MQSAQARLLVWLLGPGPSGARGHLIARWLFLRALGIIYYSAFFSWVLQVDGLLGPNGILPAGEYLKAIAQQTGTIQRFWLAPTWLWLGSNGSVLRTICWIGMIAAVLLVLNLWPRLMLAVCFVCFLSLISAAQDFSSYQSDGMLLEAGVISLFFAPGGLRPRLGSANPASRASLFLLRWEWFRIYFESGVAKIASHAPEWRNFTAMDQYYQNGPLPTWIGWYVQQLPHWFHAGAVAYTLIVELGVVFFLFLPRRWRTVCFFIVTPFEISIILTANYAFLNYLVLVLGFLLLDDRAWCLILPKGIASKFLEETPPSPNNSAPTGNPLRLGSTRIGQAASVVVLGWIFYATAALLLFMLWPRAPLPMRPVALLEPFRIANRYGLFAVMTPARYEIEFQGSSDGLHWQAYPFRFKPQDVNKPPGIFAPYQPRFDWNLWFASLESWRQDEWVFRTQALLLLNDQAVLSLFASNPFAAGPPRQVRAFVWQYWFTNLSTKRTTGAWWRREPLGLYAPSIQRSPDGAIEILGTPGASP